MIFAFSGLTLDTKRHALTRDGDHLFSMAGVMGAAVMTGLGLALVSKIVSDHSGWISVTSVPGQTVFRISLARAPKDAIMNDT